VCFLYTEKALSVCWHTEQRKCQCAADSGCRSVYIKVYLKNATYLGNVFAEAWAFICFWTVVDLGLRIFQLRLVRFRIHIRVRFSPDTFRIRIPSGRNIENMDEQNVTFDRKALQCRLERSK
jgi:hypothetical protein